MKPLLILLFSFIILCTQAQTPIDSIKIEDAWYKKDTTSLKDKLNNPQKDEMIILHKDGNNYQETREVRVINSKGSVISSYNSGPEIRIMGKNRYRTSNRGRKHYPSFNGHWCGFDYGFMNFANTDYSNYPREEGEFMELDHSNSFVMRFNVMQKSVSFVPRNNFGLVFGLSVEYQRLRFNNRHTSIAVDNQGVVYPIDLHYWKVKKNSFKNFYVNIPIMLEVQFPAKYYDKIFLSAGVVGGIRAVSWTKVVHRDLYGEKHKSRKGGSYGMNPFKADIMARLGYGHWNVWGSYTLTQMFKEDKGPELHPYAIGLGLTF